MQELNPETREVPNVTLDRQSAGRTEILEYPPFHTLYSMTIEFWGGDKRKSGKWQTQGKQKNREKKGGGENKQGANEEGGRGGGAVKWKWAQRLR